MRDTETDMIARDTELIEATTPRCNYCSIGTLCDGCHGGCRHADCTCEPVDRVVELLDACVFCGGPTDRLFWTTRTLDLDVSTPVCLSHWTDVVKPAEAVLGITRVMTVV